MAQLNFGASFYIRQQGEPWLLFDEIHLREATEYEWKWEKPPLDIPLTVLFFRMPLSYRQTPSGVGGNFVTPFQCGEASLELCGERYDTYLYPDSRKMTEQQFGLMMSDILEEATLCFDYAGLNIAIDTESKTRDLSWAQWTYIVQSFRQLSRIVEKLLLHPNRVIHANQHSIRREKVKSINTSTMQWLEKNVGRHSDEIIPAFVHTTLKTDSFITYENRVLKRQLLDFKNLLNRYLALGELEQAANAANYLDRIKYWLNLSFFKQLPAYQGIVHVSQVFRKHSIYRQWYGWFDKLYKHGNEKIGFDTLYPLKDTFQLYEIWCYMQLVKCFREQGLLQDSRGIYKTTPKGLFLNLSEHNESKVQLKNDMKLYYQRVYQYNSPHFYTFTQLMKPDIVLEKGNKLYVLDPKYRVPNNLSTALGEMHKYRDGILHRATDERAVEQVFILTPTQSDTDLRYFKKEFHEKYGMGAFAIVPGYELKGIQDWIETIKGNSS
jgi:hypothetical protein